MHLRRFRANTVREALAQAREALGPDALVLSTRLVSTGGMRGLLGERQVELTAATERGVSAGRTTRQENRPVAGDDAAVARLAAAGVEAAFAQEIACALPQAALSHPTPDALRTAVARRLSPLAAHDASLARVEVFVGPPGAGKTTTIAKIAAQRRACGGVPPRLVSADGFRVGAVEQLRLYADIIGAPFAAARAAEDLGRTLDGATGVVLVDTAGRSPRDPEARDVLELIGTTRGVRTHLVLPAATSAAIADRVFELNAAARPTRVVLTKADESAASADLLRVLERRGVTVSYLATGQAVPEDLVRATPGALASALLGDHRAECWSAA